MQKDHKWDSSWKDVNPHPQPPPLSTPWKMVQSPMYYAVNHIIYVFVSTCHFLLSMTLFVCHFACHFVCHLSLCLSAVIFTICLIIRVHLEILLWQGKSCCFYISITAVLVKLLQMIWCYVSNFAMCQSVWLFIRIFKIYTFYIMVLSHIRQRLISEVGIGVPVILGS